MTTPNPTQEISEEINALQTRVNTLQGSVQLTSSREAVEQLQTTVNGMAQRILSLRTRGYVFEKDMESQAQAFVSSWGMLYPNLEAQINTESAALVNALRSIEMQMPQLASMAGNPVAARGLLATLQSAVGQVESKVTAAEQAIEGMYNQFNNQVYTATRHLEEVEYLLTQLAEASFQLLPTEAGIAAVKAAWCKTGKEQKGDPEGVLYLTDQRLIFEQKEEIATKKVLFVVTEKQKVQGLQLETPVVLVDKVETSKQGLLKNEDHIEVHFASGAPVQAAHFHIWQDNAAWQALINRAKNKDFDQGRTVPVDQAAVEKVKAAPAQCPSCGGVITTVVLRGMDSIKCEYCGFVIRL
jgi:chromosome segregation ATPase